MGPTIGGYFCSGSRHINDVSRRILSLRQQIGFRLRIQNDASPAQHRSLPAPGSPLPAQSTGEVFTTGDLGTWLNHIADLQYPAAFTRMSKLQIHPAQPLVLVQNPLKLRPVDQQNTLADFGLFSEPDIVNINDIQL
jgi:hypothetical protein